MAAAAMPLPALTLTPFQHRVLLVPDEHDLFLGGGRGGGKSFAIALLMLRHAERYGNAARMLFVRRSFPGVVDFEATTREVFSLIYGRAASYMPQRISGGFRTAPQFSSTKWNRLSTSRSFKARATR
jgi:hypothetical protein